MLITLRNTISAGLWTRSLFHTSATLAARSKAALISSDDAIDNLTQCLDLPRDSIARLLVKKPVLQSTDENVISKTMQVLQKYGIGKGLVQEYPDLLMIPPLAIENYILILKETGFLDIRPLMLITYPELCRRSIGALKASGLIAMKENVPDNYFEILQLSPKTIDAVWSAIPGKYEQLTLLDLRLAVMHNYLADALDSSMEKIAKLIVQYPRNKHRCFGWTRENLRLLTEEFKLEKAKIVKHGYLFQSSPHSNLELLDKLKLLGGKPIAEMVNTRPKILMSSLSTLQQIEKLFDQHGITIEARSKHPEIYTLSVETLKKRLEALDSLPELIPLKTHPRVTRVLYFFNKIEKRLEYLKSIDVTGTSLHILTTDAERFAKAVEMGDVKNRGTDIVYFLSNYLSLSKSEVRKALLVHPHWLQVPPVFAKEIVQFLHKTKVYSINQIIAALPIVLYPLDKIVPEIEKVIESGEAKETDEFFLSMVLYFIERNVHFTGDGIWTHHHLPRSERVEQEHEVHDADDEEQEQFK